MTAEPLPPAIEDAILADLDAGIAVTIISRRYVATIAEIQTCCGYRGHTYETIDDGDGLWMRSYTVCTTCGAPMPDEEGPEL